MKLRLEEIRVRSRLRSLVSTSLQPGWWTEDDGSATVLCAACRVSINADRPELRTAVVHHLARVCPRFSPSGD